MSSSQSSRSCVKKPTKQSQARQLDRFYRESETQVQQSTHTMLAVAPTFGLLQKVLGDPFPSERPYRFDGDKPSMYGCDVIRRERERPSQFGRA
jgi:hypothetical protein